MGLVFLNNEEVKGEIKDKKVGELLKEIYIRTERELIRIAKELRAYKTLINIHQIHKDDIGKKIEENIKSNMNICIYTFASLWAELLQKCNETAIIDIEYSYTTEYIVTVIEVRLSGIPKQLINAMIDFKELFDKYDTIFKIIIT